MLQPMQVRLSDEDRKEYGVAQEWLPIHAGLFVERRTSVLREWEQETGIKILDLIAGEVDVRSMELLTTTMWLACKINGVTVPAFADFDPHALAARLIALELKPEGNDVDPPASSSADTSAETPPPAKAKASRPRRG
jgi:hypothetical protein